MNKLGLDFWILYLAILAAPLIFAYYWIKFFKKLENINFVEALAKILPWQLIVAVAFAIPIVSFLFLDRALYRFIWIFGCYAYWWLILFFLERMDDRTGAARGRAHIDALWPFGICFFVTLAIRFIAKSGGPIGIGDCVPIDRYGNMDCF